jgi:uncharacterized protein YbbC (DUF1343 family)
VPTFDKWQGRLCRGFQIHVSAFREYRPVLTTLCLLRAIKATHEEFSWRRPPYEFTWQHLPFDIIVGSQKVRDALDGEASFAEWRALCEEGLSDFVQDVKSFCLYEGYAEQ